MAKGKVEVKHSLNSRKAKVSLIFMVVDAIMAYIFRNHMPILTAFYGATTPIAIAFVTAQAWVDRNHAAEPEGIEDEEV